MASYSRSRIQKRNLSNKSISKRSRKIALKSPRKAPITVVANPAVDDANSMEYVYATAEISPPPRSSASLLTPIEDTFLQIGAPTNVAELITNIDPQLISLDSTSTYTDSEMSKRVSRSNSSADLAVSSPAMNEWKAVSKISEHLESDSSTTSTRTNRSGVYRPIGITMKDINGNVLWRESDAEEWRPAVYHVDIRDELIAACAREGRYLYPRERGSLPNDITAFHKDQENWGFERHQRPEILHQYEKAGYKNPTYPVPIWVYRGLVVLDYENHPILAFRNMPATISTKVEGGLQEAITREDSRIDVKDFRARMMENCNDSGRGKSALPSLSAISMRRSRFRWRAGLLSWTTRTGSQDIKDYLDSLLPDACKINNSTKGFRDLRKSEVKLMSEKNRGKHLKRAGARSITAEKRMEMDKAFYKSIEDAKAHERSSEAEEQQNVSLQGNQDYESDGLEDEDCYTNDPEDVDYEMNGLEDEDFDVDDLKDYNPEDDTIFDCEMHPPSYDYRFTGPVSTEEVQIVFYSLQPTRIQVEELTGIAPPIHPMSLSYAQQWVFLQRYFGMVWKSLCYPEEEPPLIQSSMKGWVDRFPAIEQRWIMHGRFLWAVKQQSLNTTWDISGEAGTRCSLS